MTNIKVKCRHCGNELKRDDAYSIVKGFYFCNIDCYNNYMRKKSGEAKAKGNSKIKYKPADDGSPRRRFTDLIQKIYLDAGWDKDDINWLTLMAQAKNILSEHEAEGWDYPQMTAVLDYMYNILNLNLVTRESNYNVLSLLPYYYLECKQYYQQTQEIIDAIEEFDFSDVERVIKQKPRQKKKILLEF